MHPFRLANDQLTAVTGVMQGTFTKPMPDAKGGFIKPTGKDYALPMVTVGIWNRHNTMDEEYLFWDNRASTPRSASADGHNVANTDALAGSGQAGQLS